MFFFMLKQLHVVVVKWSLKEIKMNVSSFLIKIFIVLFTRKIALESPAPLV